MKPRKLNATETLATTAYAAVRDLFKQARRGDSQAAEILVCYLTNWTGRLCLAERDAPAVFQPLARKAAIWPGFLTIDKDIQKREANRAVALEFGKDSPLHYKGRKQWTRDTPENKVALDLLEWVLVKHRNLPAFSRATYKTYYALAVKELPKHYGKDFENHPAFSHYRNHPNVKNSEPDLRADTKRRQMILTKLEQSFHTIARRQPAQ